MPIHIYQFGGYTGSYAGDCCTIGADGSYLMIDLGLNMGSTSTRIAGTQATKGLTQVAAQCDLDVVVTHFHSDHINDGRSWAELSKRNAKIHHGQSTNAPSVDAMKKALGHLTTQYEPKDNGKLIVEKTVNEWKIKAYVIVPDLSTVFKPDENDASLGVLVELYKGNSTPISILTVGDMTPETGNAAVQTVLQQRGYGSGQKEVTSVKLSHHGSESNLLEVLDSVIGKQTTVLISGYTLTAVNQLAAKLKQWDPKQIFMLFDERGRQDFDSIAGTESPKLLQKAGVQFLTDFHVQLT